MRSVFISYATADRTDAVAICEAIERRGTPCWIASRDVQPGENYQEAIVHAIRQSRALVLVFSDRANNSDEIKKELSLVSRYHIPLIALRTEDVEPSDAFAYELSTRQWIDLFVDWDRSLDVLVRRIDQLSPHEPDASPDTVAAAAIAPVSRSARAHAPASPQPTRRRTLISAAAVLLIAAVVGGWFLLRPTASAAHTMDVRLTGFDRLSPDLPAGMPDATRDEIIAAFNNDGVVGVSTATAPPPGTAPAYALGGSMRHDGERVRIIARLTNERSGVTLWSNTYNYDAKDVGRIPRWMAVNVGDVIRSALFAASTYPKALPDPVLAAYLQFAQNLANDGGGPTKALDFAHKVVAIAPDFSWGWSAVEIAAAAAIDPQSPKQLKTLRDEALRAADTALQLDPSNSEALAYKSWLIDQGDLAGREALLQRALRARPLACGCEHHFYAAMLEEVGRTQDAIAEFRRSIDVLALNPSSQVELASALIATGKPQEAKAHIDAALDLSTDPALAGLLAVFTAPLTGEYATGLKAAQDPAAQAPPELQSAVIAAFEAMISGNPHAKAAAADRLVALPVGTGALLKVRLLGALGANAQALRMLEGAIAANRAGLRATLFEPTLAGARADPDFPGVLQRLGLIRYWKASHTRPDFCTVPNAPTVCRSI